MKFRSATSPFLLAALLAGVSARESHSVHHHHSVHRRFAGVLRPRPALVRDSAEPDEKAVMVYDTKEPPLIDAFAMTYWGSVFGAIALIVSAVAYYDKMYPKCLSGEDDEEYGMNDVGEKVIEIPENMWSVNFITAMGQAKCGGRKLPLGLVMCMSLLLGALQLFTILLIVIDIDPDAHPITTDPTSPWKKSTWTINCMKWIMVIFLVMGLVPEVADSQVVFAATLEIHRDRLNVPKFIPLCMTIAHMLVTLCTIWGGVNAICSFGAVPDIVFSSLSITFLANVDNIFYEFFRKTLDIEADFTVVHRRGENIDLPRWNLACLKILLLLPILWGGFLIGRAWHTDIMPSGRARFLKAFLEAGAHALTSGP